MKNTIVIFDLFDTILYDESIDFNRGLEILWKNHFRNVCTFKEMTSYGEELFIYLRNKQKNNDEVSFANDEVPLYYKKFGVQPINITEEEEFNIAEAINQEIFYKEVENVLDIFKNNNIPMYILSNSIFSAKALKKLLEKYEADKYFIKIWSSADYGKRKPEQKFFLHVIEEILKSHTDANKKNIIYVGNSYKYDACGGSEAGLKTVWLNREGLPNTNNLQIDIIENFNELLDFVL